MNFRPTYRVLLRLCLVVCLAAPLAAEELVLKNGQKIVGTIVGYEGDMFRVETGFGFALVRKDSVVSISFSGESGKRTEPESGAGAMPASPEKISSGSSKIAPAAPPPVAKALPPPVSRPLDQPLPAHIQERVQGTDYINETFQFAMYKPPGWRIFEGISRETGRAVVAIGTEDERTLLIVDRQIWSGPPDLQSKAVEDSFRQTYQDYQRESETTTKLDGRAAVRRVFSGLMDGVEWHGVSAHVARGNTMFGIIGLTSAETYEFRQAVFNKIIKSFRFLAAKP